MDAKSMNRRWSALIGAFLAAAVLSACGGSANGPAAQPSGPGASTNVEADSASSSAGIAAGKDKARFVNVAVDPTNGTGTAVDYIAVPDAADAYITAAGGTTILNAQDEDNEVFDADGLDDNPALTSQPLSDTYIVHSESSSTATESGSPAASDSVLTVQQMNEPADFNEDDGQDLPIAGKAVLITSMVGVSKVDTSSDPGADERQFGIVDSGSCLPEEHNELLGGHDSYMATYSQNNIVEYVADPGQLTLGIWSTGDKAACTGTPPVTFAASLAGGQRYYAIGYGSPSAPKVLLLSIPAPLSGKTASPTPQPTD